MKDKKQVDLHRKYCAVTSTTHLTGLVICRCNKMSGLVTPFEILNNEKVYGFEGEYGKKNFTEYQKFYLLNRVRHFIQSEDCRECLPYYHYETTKKKTRLFIKVKKGSVDLTDIGKYQMVVDKYVSKMKNGRLVIYDFNFEDRYLDHQLVAELLFWVKGLKITDNVVFGHLDPDNFLEELVECQNLLSGRQKSRLVYVGNNWSVRYNISLVVKRPVFCDGFLVSGVNEEMFLGLSLPEVGGEQELTNDPSTYQFKVVDQFRSYCRYIPETEPVVNLKRVKVSGFENSRLVRDLFKRYVGIEEVVFAGGKLVGDQVEVYESQLMKIRTFLLPSLGNYLCDNPLVFLCKLDNLSRRDTFFFYSGERDPSFEDDILNKIRIMETRGYFWYELETIYDPTFDLIKEIVEIYTGAIFGVYDRFVLGRGDVVNTVLKIKIGQLKKDAVVRLPGKIVKRVSGPDTFFEVLVDGRTLELNGEISQEQWETGAAVNNWCRYYFSKTGKLSSYYL